MHFREAPPPAPTPLLRGTTIAIARDAAYAFIYPANLDSLRALGADLVFFSPLAGDDLPECDAVWLPGGYPELHGERLAANAPFWRSLRAHAEVGRPVLAECGGMMSLFESVVDKAGAAFPGGGLLPGRAVMQPRLAALGLQCAELPEGRLMGHTFHYSRSETPLSPLVRAMTPDGREGEAIYRVGRLTASYVHFYFPSDPAVVAALLRRQ